MAIALICFVLLAKAIPCSGDTECRVTTLGDFTSLFCSAGKCTELREGGSPCSHPGQCASYPYYGPAACSASCTSENECRANLFQKTVFCCRSIPLGGACRLNRPGVLSGCATGQKCSLVDGKAVCLEKNSKIWALGAIFSITGNLLINAGVNTQKLSYRKGSISFAGCAISTMLFGTLIYACGKVLAFSAYFFGAQSILAGLSGIGLISNSILAPIMNHEHFAWRDVAAIVCVFFGTGIMLLNASRSHKRHNSCELFKMYNNFRAIVWFSSIIVVIALLYLFIRFIEVNSDWRFPDDRSHFMRSNRFFSREGFLCKYVMVLPYVMLSAMIASFSALSAKSLGEILHDYFQSRAPPRRLLIAVLLGALAFFTTGQIYWLNRGLRHYDALLVVPLYHVTWTLLSIATAGIYFQDFDHYSSRQFRWFIASICIIFCGSIFLAARVVEQNRVNGDVIRGRGVRIDRLK